jgi:hypothetical protein
MENFNITAQSRYNKSEPTVQWNQQLKRYDTLDIRRQLGTMATVEIPENRGIMKLDFSSIQSQILMLRPNWKIPDLLDVHDYNYRAPLDRSDNWFNWFNSSTIPWILGPIWNTLKIKEGISAAFCFQCDASAGGITLTDSLQAMMFNDIIEETGSPALALQAYTTTVLRMAYYDYLPLFDTSSQSTSSSFKRLLVPVSSRGYITVLCITVIHCAFMMIITFIFIQRTQCTMLDNSWQAVSQLVTDQVSLDILSNSSMSLDKEVTQWLKEHGKGQTRVRLQQRQELERVGLVEYP